MNKTEQTFRIGATVQCDDKVCGEVEKVVVDPHTRRITALIVSKGGLFRKARVVPASAVRRTHPHIELDLDVEQLDDLPAYRERVYSAPPEDWEDDRADVSAEDMVVPMHPWGTLGSTALRPMVRYRVHEGVSDEEIVVERGIAVVGDGRTIGTVDHLMADTKTREFTHLVIDRGPFAPRLVVPRELIAKLGDDEIALEAGEDELSELPEVSARDDEDILAELHDKLAEMPFDPDTIDIVIESGVVQLSGTVADVATKRHIDALARSVNGVVDVVDELDTATTLRARVVSALASDPRTDLAVIDVAAQGGTVTLTGNVDSDAVKKAAELIASEQEGVAQVINHLEIEPDEDADWLSLRPHAWANIAGHVGSSPGTGGAGAHGPNPGYL